MANSRPAGWYALRRAQTATQSAIDALAVVGEAVDMAEVGTALGHLDAARSSLREAESRMLTVAAK